MSAKLKKHPIYARLYASQSVGAEDKGVGDMRKRALAGASGRVIEVGAGNGLNFAHYPDTVTEVVAIEPEPFLREQALAAAAKATVPVEVIDGIAEELPVEDDSFDVALAFFVLCSVSDLDRAVAELYRVTRPGGELRFNEHVNSDRPAIKAIQRVADATIWPHVAGGCHLGRDTGAAITAAGFQIESSDRFTFSIGLLDPPKPHIEGVARKPSANGAAR